MRLGRYSYKQRSDTRGERGAAMVEFALVCTFLVGIAFGVVEYTIAYRYRQEISRIAFIVGSSIYRECVSSFARGVEVDGCARRELNPAGGPGQGGSGARVFQIARQLEFTGVKTVQVNVQVFEHGLVALGDGTFALTVPFAPVLLVNVNQRVDNYLAPGVQDSQALREPLGYPGGNFYPPTITAASFENGTLRERFQSAPRFLPPPVAMDTARVLVVEVSMPYRSIMSNIPGMFSFLPARMSETAVF